MATDHHQPLHGATEGDLGLARMLALVEGAAHARGWGAPAQLLRIDPETGADGVAVAVHPLPAGVHPEAALLGFDAPPDWATIGVLAEGTARELSPGGDVPWPPEGPPARGAADAPIHRRPAAGVPPVPGHEGGLAGMPSGNGTSSAAGGADRRVRVAVVAARTGLVTSRVRVDGRPPFTATHRPGAAATTGLVVDLLLRALGLPTAPAPATTAPLWAVCWLEMVLATPGVAGMRWPAVARLHPSLHPLAAGRTSDTPARRLAEFGSAAGRLVGWAALRDDAMAGRWSAPRLLPADAAWLDTGAFARWVLGELAPIDALAAEVRTVLPADVAREVDRCLRAWHLLGTADGMADQR